MTTVEKLFGFQGRLRRRDWWLFTVLLIVAELIVTSILSVAMGVPGFAMPGSPMFGRYMLVRLVVTVIFLWPGLAISVKRLHDREHSGWWLAAPYGFIALQVGLAVWRLAGAGGIGILIGILSLLVALLILVAAVWLLVELGFLDGTPGPNEYGRSPKDVSDPAPAAT